MFDDVGWGGAPIRILEALRALSDDFAHRLARQVPLVIVVVWPQRVGHLDDAAAETGGCRVL